MENFSGQSSVNSRLIKQIPNIFTLLNLFFGCLAIIVVTQPGLIVSQDENLQQIIDVPEKMVYASLFIAIAAVIDFLDGFVARLLKATSEMGKQLDSLADVVSFGVAPGMIIYQFLRLSYSQDIDSLNNNSIWLYFAFILPCAGAYRLARFNLDTNQEKIFKGVPIPAIGLLVASYPLVYFNNHTQWIYELIMNQWFWFAAIIILSYLMVSTHPMISLKLNGINVKSLTPLIIILLVAIITGILFGWLAITFSFFAYIIVSYIFLRNQKSTNQPIN